MKTVFFEGVGYDISRCLSGDCKGCGRKHYASCDVILTIANETEEAQA